MRLLHTISLVLLAPAMVLAQTNEPGKTPNSDSSAIASELKALREALNTQQKQITAQQQEIGQQQQQIGQQRDEIQKLRQQVTGAQNVSAARSSSS